MLFPLTEVLHSHGLLKHLRKSHLPEGKDQNEDAPLWSENQNPWSKPPIVSYSE